MNVYLYAGDEVPDGFEYPESYIEIMSRDFILDIEPWFFICEFKNSALFWMSEIKQLYPTRKLIPFAKVNYSDDIACFDGEDSSGNPKVYYIHAFASSGWEDRGFAENFDEWLEIACLESAHYKEDQLQNKD